MKYLEELCSGDCFSYQENIYLLTADFKSSGQKLCYNLRNGSCRWFEQNLIIEDEQLYILDTNNNFHPVKELEKTKNV